MVMFGYYDLPNTEHRPVVVVVEVVVVVVAQVAVVVKAVKYIIGLQCINLPHCNITEEKCICFIQANTEFCLHKVFFFYMAKGPATDATDAPQP
jgi:hypothetical protein